MIIFTSMFLRARFSSFLEIVFFFSIVEMVENELVPKNTGTGTLHNDKIENAVSCLTQNLISTLPVCHRKAYMI